MRLPPATLAELHAAALDGRAFPTDVIRLVREVWALNDRIRTLEETVGVGDDPDRTTRPPDTSVVDR